MSHAPLSSTLTAQRRVAIVDLSADLADAIGRRAARLRVVRRVRARSLEHARLDLVLPRFLALDRLEVRVRRGRERSTSTREERPGKDARELHRDAK